MNLIFFGPPGAGKGTQAEIVSKALNIPTISTGAIIRAAISEKTELGLSAQSYIESGALVPDNVVIGMVAERLENDDCKNGFILDGFPRTIPQAEALSAMGVNIDAVVSLEVEDDVIVKRMSGRRLCSKCGLPYHTVFNPTKVENVCDACGGALKVRADDAPDVVQSRLDTYHKETEPLKRYYTDKGILISVAGQSKIEDTTVLVKAALNITI